MEQSGDIPIFNIPAVLFRNIPQSFIGIFFQTYWVHLMRMFHKYSTNIYFLDRLYLRNVRQIPSPSSNLIATSNNFDLFSENTENSLDIRKVISTEHNNAESYSNKSKKTNNTSISTQLGKSELQT